MKTIVPNWTVPPHIQAFTTTREGGVSLPPFESFNLGDHVEDNKSAVKNDRTFLFSTNNQNIFLIQKNKKPDITSGFLLSKTLIIILQQR